MAATRLQAYPEELARAEDELILARRTAVARASAPGPVVPSSVDSSDPTLTQAVDALGGRVGVALSGGGIRSATFCLGVFQSLAARGLVRHIDYLSTVSGGGYFGSFFGSLFARNWIGGVTDVEQVLQGADADPKKYGSRVFRHLRDNGRYLAPRGSGDLLIAAAAALRNWVAVQVVLAAFAVTVFVGLQLLRIPLDTVLALLDRDGAVSTFLTCTMPYGSALMLWSPWLLTVAVPLLVVVIPSGWAYWLVATRRDGQIGIHPVVGVLVIFGCAIAALAYLLLGGDNFGIRSTLVAVLAVVAALAVLFWLVALTRRAPGRRRSVGEEGSDADRDADVAQDASNVARNRLSRCLAIALVFTFALLALGLIDSAGASLYAATAGRVLGQWAAAFAAALAAGGAFARPLAAFLSARRGGGRGGVPLSVVTWVAAIAVYAIWLVFASVASHAIAWRFERQPLPAGFAAVPAPTVLGASSVLVETTAGGFRIKAAADAAPACVPAPTVRPAVGFTAGAFGLLALLSFLFGRTRTFANMSSLHAFYAARLTRAYLGATNDRRIASERSCVSESMAGDDVTAASYWNWPAVPSGGAAAAAGPWDKGGPLHLVNVTVNETLDGRTGVQHQDRKGTSLAIGPAGLSLGARHHLVRVAGRTVALPKPSPGLGRHAVHRVFKDEGPGVTTPEPLPLGRWTGISGAAFTTAAGSQTTVAGAMLAGMFNVRLGYWWNSGMPGWRRNPFALAFPVQAALLSEMLARTRGTAERLWMLSDGGHFENMGAYELIRRRLPLIIVIDAEADPEYRLEGLATLVRKARLDFGAEITFADGDDLADAGSAVPAAVRSIVGTLDMLRRGAWERQPLPAAGADRSTLSITVDQQRESCAHAALARVQYHDGGEPSWLYYVKTTLSGDEPVDVRHYHASHPAFPHEPTLDQFFDEAQWESYRRLGEHVGDQVLTPAVFAMAGSTPPAAAPAP